MALERLSITRIISRWVQRAILRVVMFVTLSLCCSACSYYYLLLPAPKPVVEGAYLVHIVGPTSASEDIDTILLWYTGSENLRDAVQSVNKKLNLSDLRPGQRLLIPLHLVTHTNPMPRRKFNFAGTSDPLPAPQPPQELRGRATKNSQPRSQEVDPLEAMASKRRATKRAEREPRSESEPETFDLENDGRVLGPESENSVDSNPAIQVDSNDVRRDLQGVSDEFKDQITSEQAELEKLRRELDTGNGGAAQAPNPLQ